MDQEMGCGSRLPLRARGRIHPHPSLVYANICPSLDCRYPSPEIFRAVLQIMFFHHSLEPLSWIAGAGINVWLWPAGYYIIITVEVLALPSQQKSVLLC